MSGCLSNSFVSDIIKRSKDVLVKLLWGISLSPSKTDLICFNSSSSKSTFSVIENKKFFSESLYINS